MEDTYFVIQNSDGDTTVNEYTKEELIKAVENNDFSTDIEFIDSIGEDDTNYWGDGILVIKGKIVSPEPIEKIVRYTIE